jgi:hypothetical protein
MFPWWVLFLGDEDRRTNNIDCCVWIALVIFVSLLDNFFIVVFLRRDNFVSAVRTFVFCQHC